MSALCIRQVPGEPLIVVRMACRRCGEGGEAGSSKLQKEGFGECSNYAECEAVCPKEFIGYMNRESLKETLARPLEPRGETQVQ